MWGVADGETRDMPTAWTHHGVGLAFRNCARITMPLAPTLGVIIARNERGGRSISAADFNRATVYNSREFVAHHPDGLADATLRYALHDDMRRSAGFSRSSGEPHSAQRTRRPARSPTSPTSRSRLGAGNRDCGSCAGVSHGVRLRH